MFRPPTRRKNHQARPQECNIFLRALKYQPEIKSSSRPLTRVIYSLPPSRGAIVWLVYGLGCNKQHFLKKKCARTPNPYTTVFFFSTSYMCLHCSCTKKKNNANLIESPVDRVVWFHLVVHQYSQYRFLSF